MKFLCVCQGGNVRSHGLAYVLHNLFGQEAVAIGHLKVSEKTLSYFAEWADYVVCMTEEIATHIPTKFIYKIRIVDVGEDRWGVYVNPELLKFFKETVRDWKSRDFII